MNFNTMGVFFKYTACVVAYKYKYEFMVLKALGIKHFILILVLVISSPTVWQIVCVCIVYQQCCCVCVASVCVFLFYRYTDLSILSSEDISILPRLPISWLVMMVAYVSLAIPVSSRLIHKPLGNVNG